MSLDYPFYPFVNFREDYEEMLLNIAPYSYPENVDTAIELIRKAVLGEREDELFYNELIRLAPNEDAKEIIESIRDDEKKHNKMVRSIYYQLTGQMLPKAKSTNPDKEVVSYCAGIKQALMGELKAVERYRQILFAMQNRIFINLLTEIITDELRHANYYNFLYTEACQDGARLYY